MRRIKLWTFKWTPPLLLHHPKGSRMDERIDFPIPCQSSMSTVPLISIRLVSCFTFLRKVIRLFWESEFFCFFVFFSFPNGVHQRVKSLLQGRGWLETVGHVLIACVLEHRIFDALRSVNLLCAYVLLLLLLLLSLLLLFSLNAWRLFLRKIRRHQTLGLVIRPAPATLQVSWAQMMFFFFFFFLKICQAERPQEFW